jgi:hypothetical protein
MHGQIDEHEKTHNCWLNIFSTVELKKESEESILSSSVDTKDRSKCYGSYSSFVIAFQMQRMSSSVIDSSLGAKGYNN